MRSSSVARHSISGSRAAFSITVVPSASVAAIISCCGRADRREVEHDARAAQPLRLGLDVAVADAASRAPIFSRPARWRSTGRAPMAQPPGVDTRAWPKRASSGPSARNDARIVFTRSYGASVRPSVARFDRRPRARRRSRATSAPRWRSTASVVRMSASAGTCRSVQRSGVSSVANSSGRAAFFAPLTSTSPSSTTPPRITMLSTSPPPSSALPPRARCRRGRARPRCSCSAVRREEIAHRGRLAGADLDQQPAAGREHAAAVGDERAQHVEPVGAGGERERAARVAHLGRERRELALGAVRRIRHDEVERRRPRRAPAGRRATSRTPGACRAHVDRARPRARRASDRSPRRVAPRQLARERDGEGAAAGADSRGPGARRGATRQRESRPAARSRGAGTSTRRSTASGSDQNSRSPTM